MAIRSALAAPAAAYLSAAQADPGVYGWTPGRVGASTAALLGLIGVVIGVLALVRSVRRRGAGHPRRAAFVALAAGVIAVSLGVLVLAVADGGPGTGNGVVGAYLALATGPIALLLGGMVLARSRRPQLTD